MFEVVSNLSQILKTWKVRWKWEVPEDVVDKADEAKISKALWGDQGDLNQRQEEGKSPHKEEEEAL
jgi:hypothetical protein